MTDPAKRPDPQVRHVGLEWRQCGCRHFLTACTRPRGNGIIRRKRCPHCGKAITTRQKRV